MKSFLMLGLCSLAVFGGGPVNGGGGGTTPGVQAPGTVEVRTLNERVPAGSTVQAKFLFTQPRPISSTGPRMYVDDYSVNGISAFSPNGDTAGVGFVLNKYLNIEVISPDSDFGTNLDYPFLTVAVTIPASVPTGTKVPLAFADGIFQSPTGPLTLVSKPGILTVGGSVGIDGVYPGGGTWPAGTILHVRGRGFQPNTKLTTRLKATAAYVSPSEMIVRLNDVATVDSQAFTALNPDGSSVTYYSYLRGVLVQAPSRALLQHAEPIFQTQTHGIGTVGPLTALDPGQFLALAIQNPTAGPVAVTFYHQQSGKSATITLPSGGRLLEDVQVLLGGVVLSVGDTVTVSATSAVQMLGIKGDENLGTLAPFLPVF